MLALEKIILNVPLQEYKLPVVNKNSINIDSYDITINYDEKAKICTIKKENNKTCIILDDEKEPIDITSIIYLSILLKEIKKGEYGMSSIKNNNLIKTKVESYGYDTNIYIIHIIYSDKIKEYDIQLENNYIKNIVMVKFSIIDVDIGKIINIDISGNSINITNNGNVISNICFDSKIEPRIDKLNIIISKELLKYYNVIKAVIDRLIYGITIL